MSAGLDAYHRISDETDSSFYGSQSTGGQLRLGIPLYENLSGTVFTGIERKVIADTNGNPQYQSSLVHDGQEFYKAFVGYTLTYNSVDNVKKPTEGLYGTFTQQYIGWDHNLLKTEVRARYFMPIMADSGIVASVRGQVGVINDFSGNGVNTVEAFSPGTQLVRGFKSRGYGPRLTTGETTGVTLYAGVSAEVQFPIPVLPESYGLSGALWADAGWLSTDNMPNLYGGTVAEGSNDTPLRTSIGASLIWDSPFGPLRGDFAHVLDKSTDDQTQVFQISISTLL